MAEIWAGGWQEGGCLRVMHTRVMNWYETLSPAFPAAPECWSQQLKQFWMQMLRWRVGFFPSRSQAKRNDCVWAVAKAGVRKNAPRPGTLEWADGEGDTQAVPAETAGMRAEGWFFCLVVGSSKAQVAQTSPRAVNAEEKRLLPRLCRAGTAERGWEGALQTGSRWVKEGSFLSCWSPIPLAHGSCLPRRAEQRGRRGADPRCLTGAGINFVGSAG